MFLARYCIMLSLRDDACLLELLVVSLGRSAADTNTTIMKMIIGVTMKKSVGRSRIREHRVADVDVFCVVLPVDMSAGYEPWSLPTSASVRS